MPGGRFYSNPIERAITALSARMSNTEHGRVMTFLEFGVTAETEAPSITNERIRR